MRRSFCHAVALFALVAGLGTAVAQQAPSTDQQQKQSLETKPGQAGTTEPAAHAPSSKPQDNAVFIDGALAVPGAPRHSDTVPAKFSERNDADDKLITTAYTFKTLTDEQRRAIYQALKGNAPGNAPNVDVGTQLPASIQSSAVPDAVASDVPQTKGYHYLVADKNVLLVAPASRVVVGVIAPGPAAQGSR